MAGCGGVGGSVGDRLRRTEIEGMFNEFENAWESMDEERVLSFYHEDYELVSPSTGEVLTRTDVELAVAIVMHELDDIVLDIEVVNIEDNGDGTVRVEYISTSRVKYDGLWEEEGEVQGAFILKKENGQWYIIGQEEATLI